MATTMPISSPEHPTNYRRARLGAVALGLIVSLGIALLVAHSRPARGAVSDGPNLIVIVSDDQEYVTANRRYMPHTIEDLADAGTRFDNFVITTPLCCPSRATQLTGQYGHNNGVLSNKPGYPTLIDPDNTLPVWLQGAGYTTAHIGKYLNGYKRAGDPLAPAPGWDVWYTNTRQRYYNYTLSSNGTPIEKGDAAEDYSTDVYTRRAVGLIRRRFDTDPNPFYLQLDYLAPHVDGTATAPCRFSPIPAERDEHRFPHLRVPMPPSYDEADTSDKPDFIAALPPFSARTERAIRARYRCRVQSLQAVDRGIDRIVRALDATGLLDNTVILFYSDNGYHSGEHRLAKSKGLAYEEDILSPLLVRLPESLAGESAPPREISDPIGNIDLVPTILDFAGTDPCIDSDTCRVLDGLSFRGLIDNSGGSWPARRPLGIDIAQDGALAGGTRACRYHAMRVDREVIIQHERTLDPRTKRCEDSTEVEHYRLDSDPYEIRNLYPGPTFSQLRADQEALLSELEQIHVCAGIEGRDPEPASGVYCG